MHTYDDTHNAVIFIFICVRTFAKKKETILGNCVVLCDCASELLKWETNKNK